MTDKVIKELIKGLLKDLIKDGSKKVTTDDDIDKLIEKQLETAGKKAPALKDKEDATIIETTVKKSEQLAKISKRREELKEKLEGGQLKADEASSIGIEYRIKT